MDFAFACNEIKIKTNNRLHACAQFLGTGSAFFAASDTVTRQNWKIFNQHSKYNKYLPGIQGIGFSMIIPKNEKEQHIQKIRKEGFPEYTIIPAGERPFYTSAVYIEPFEDANRRSFGYDMFSESVSRKAMEQSRDSDIAILSGKVLLRQNDAGDSQAGVLMYLPVYYKNMPVKTVEERRAAIKGWVFTPYHIDDLMDGLLGHWDSDKNERIRLQIYDEAVSLNSLIYDSQAKDSLITKQLNYRTVNLKVKSNGEKWILCFSQPIYQPNYFQDLTKIVLTSGILISFLLFLLSLALLNTRARAQQIADELTHDLRKSEERIREVLENTMDASYKRNLKTSSYDYLSPAFFRISGYTPEEITNLPFNTIPGFIHADDESEINRVIASALNDSSSTVAKLQYRFRRKDGQFRWIQDRFRIVRDSQGIPEALIGSVSDITDRIQIEETLRNERLLLRTLIDNIPDSIYCMDLDCRKTLANTTDLFYMGAKSESEVIGKNDFDFYPKEIAEKFFEVDYSAIQSGKPLLNVEEYLVDINGNAHWLLTSKIPMYNNEGEITGLLGYGREITERKLAEEEIKEKNEQLQKLNASKDKLFSVIAHDLRSPFNGFLGLTQLMVEDLSTMTLEEIQTIALSMRNSATTLYRLLENLLQWSMLQQNRISFNPALIPLSPLVSDSIGMANLLATSKEIRISTNISDDILVFADSNMLLTILRNLVSNGVKFTKKGGQVIISAETLDNFTIISIEDSGIGMTPDMVNDLFRLDVNTSRKGTDGESSTGLGLIICKDFVEKHSGTMWVESEVGKGSTFCFSIPNCLI